MDPVFSHGYCKNHQYLRTDSSYLQKQKIAKEKRFHPAKKITRDMNFGFKNELEMFMNIWHDRSHICEFTGNNLEKYRGTHLFFSCFLHILPKGKFPLFKLNAENVVLGDPEFHRIVDAGTKADRLKHPLWDFDRWDKLVYQMKEKYIQFKKDNLLS